MFTRATLALAGASLLAWSGPAAAQTSLFGQPVQEAPAAPAASPEAGSPAPKPRKPKPRGPVPARALTISNLSSNVLTELEVSGGGKSARLTKPLAPKERTTLKLPPMKTCNVTITAMFEGAGQVDPGELNTCRDKVIRFTDG